MTATRSLAIGLGVVAAAWATGCSDPTTTGITQLNLDRPVDVAFACYGSMRVTDDPNRPIISTAMPVSECQQLSPALADDAQTPSPGQKDVDFPSWYAFILQSASGTVALATWGSTQAENMEPNGSVTHDMLVLDADPLTPGKNAISIGEDPIAIATDKAGCFEITANAGSCDLSELEINSALDNTVRGSGGPATPVRVDRKPVTMAGQVLRARPAAMVAEPGAQIPIDATEMTSPIGKVCPMTATGRVYVAYPSCHMVASIDTSDGNVVAAIRFDTGVPTVVTGAALADVRCADECVNDKGVLGNGAITAGVRPVALDLRFDPRMDASKLAPTMVLAIGSDVSGAPDASPLTLVQLDPATADPVVGPQSPLPISLEPSLKGKVSVTAVALSPQIGMGGNFQVAQPPEGIHDDDAGTVQGQYVYAVATDGTVRVADILNLRRECDTQIDSRFLVGTPAPTIAELQCMPIGDPTRPRRSGARGPGIELPGGGVPNSVAIVKGRTLAPPIKDADGKVTGYALPGAGTLVGYFAIITSANGTAYVVNIDDDDAPDVPRKSGSPARLDLSTAPPLVMAHQLRDNFFQRNAQPQVNITPTNSTTVTPVPACTVADPLVGVLGGGPRITSPPAQVIPASTLAADKITEMPQIRHLECDDGGDDPPGNHALTRYSVSELEFAAPADVRSRVYPDLRSVSTEAWNLTWEGTLSLDNGNHAVDGPPIRDGTITVDDLGMHLQDPAQPFCEVGVEPYDIADLRGCDPANNDSDCPHGYVCYVHPKYVNPPGGASVGACMLKSEAPRLADACRDFLTTRRRYTVGFDPDAITPGSLVLLERKHELATTPVEGCVSDDQCNSLAQVAARIDASADPFTARTHWSCQTDPLRAPVNSDPAKNKRCMQVCSTDPSDASYPYDCASGTVCRALNPGVPTDHRGVCLEGVEPPQSCLNGPQRYDFRASEAFTVIGGLSGYVHPRIAKDVVVKDRHTGADKHITACVTPALDPAGPGPVQIGRIPLRVPACTLAETDPSYVTGRLPAGGFEANPCAVTTSQYDNVSPTAVACDAAPGTLGTSTFATRDAPALRFRNRAMTMTIVDPYRTCLLAPPPGSPDGTPSTPTNVPFTATGYQLEFAQKAGFFPITFTLPLIATTSPVKVVRGPTDSIWVIDDGDYLSSSITQASTRGRVYRVESVSTNIVNILQ